MRRIPLTTLRVSVVEDKRSGNPVGRISLSTALQRFGERVRDEVDLARIEDSLRWTASDAFGPTGVRPWLRESGR